MKPHSISADFTVLAIMFSLMLPGECLAGGYNGQAACNYAATYWDEAVSDGYYWINEYNSADVVINGDNPVYFGGGTSVSTIQTYIDNLNNSTSGGNWWAGDDCAHFVSSCIGAQGGGLSVPARPGPPYGYASAPNLVSWLISSGNGVASSESALQVGDVIGYDWDGNGTIDHVALYIGNGQIAAHSSCYWGKPYNSYATDYPNVKYTFIHILTTTPPPSISVTVQPSISGRSFTVDGTQYTTAQTFSWTSGSSHTIATTSPQSGSTGTQYVWGSWSDGGAMSHTVAPTVGTTYTANFMTQYYLTTGYGAGGSSVSPGGEWCNSGASVTLSATPASGYSFSSWTGSGTGSYSGSSPSPSITMNGPISEMANFKANPPSISVTVQPSISGRSFTVDGTQYTTAQTFSWTSGSSHTIATTSPQSGSTGTQYVWGSWSDGGAMSHTVAPTVGTTYTANFMTQYYLTTGYGAGGSSVSPGGEWCNSGASVTLSATPASGYSFSSWTGSGTGSYSGSSPSPSITMNGPISEMANFKANPPSISVTVQPSISGRSFTVDGTQYTTAQTFSWTSGSSHTIATTSPQSGSTGTQYVWGSWSDGGAMSHTVAPTVGTTYTANFTTQYYLTTGYGAGGSSVSPGGEWCNSGASVTLSATPASGYSFSSWTGSGTGSYSGSSPSPSITMNGPISEMANFKANPPSISVTVQPSISGRSFTVDGTQYTTAQTFSWTSGSSHTIATTSPQSGSTGTQYVWGSWSDGGAMSHTVAPTVGTTYTAAFSTQYYLTMGAGTGGAVSPSSAWNNRGSIVAIMATANGGYAFSAWAGTGSGSYSGNAPSASVTVSGPITEAASFSTLLPIVAGTYTGLFYDATNGVTPQSAGSFTLKTTTKGSFSGNIQSDGTKYSLSGQFDSNGRATKVIARRNLSSLTVELQLDLAPGADRLTGTVSDGVWTAVLTADRAVFDGKTSIAPQAGQYTLIIPGDYTSTTEVGGYSYGTLTVSKAGAVSCQLFLADGTKLTPSGSVSKYGQWPLYASLSSGQGLIVSWLTFTNAPAEELTGDLVWTKPSTPNGRYYPNGFTLTTTLSGSQYTQPGKGANVLTLTEGYVALEGGDLAQNITDQITLGANNRVTDLSGNKLGLSFTPSTGLFTGHVTDPATRKPVSFNGVVLQKSNVGYGYFLGTSHSGQVLIQGP